MNETNVNTPPENPSRERGKYHIVPVIEASFDTKLELLAYVKDHPGMIDPDKDYHIIHGKERIVKKVTHVSID